MRTEAAPPNSALLADAAADLPAAYVHIPFCRRVCPYCDFAVVEGTGTLAGRYVDALLAEIEGEAEFTRPLAAIAIGGGTPTSLAPSVLARVVAALGERFGLADHAEVSVEANPEDVSPESLLALRDAGVTRLSLGVQSLDDDVLKWLGRTHTAEQALRAVNAATSVFPSVGVDLMFGTPGESLDAWMRSVSSVLAAGVDHLSLYALTVERGTALSRLVAAGSPGPDPDDQAAKYEAGVDACESAGLVRYETSNLARPGHASVYNLITWAQGEYAAFGNGAHRHRDGIRSWNVRRVDRYVEAISTGRSAVSGQERGGPWDREVERVMLGLRRAAGVRKGLAGAALLESTAGIRLGDAGVVAEAGDRLVVARPLMGDEVSRALLALEPLEC